MPSTIKLMLAKAIQSSPSADNSQPWCLEFQDDTLIIKYDFHRVDGKTFSADSGAILLSIGACIENVRKVALAYKLDMHVDISDHFDFTTSIYCSFHFQPGVCNEEVDELDLPLFHRYTNRKSYKGKPLPQHLLGSLQSKLPDPSIIITDEKVIFKISRLIQRASEIRFQTKENNDWLARSLRFGNQAELTNDGLDVATLDLPPGGALFLRVISDWKTMIWLNKLGCYKFMSYIDSLPVKKASTLIAIVGKKGFQESLSAGQIMQRVWIDLNSQGVAVHPYYVISDQISRYSDGSVPKKLEQKVSVISSEVSSLFSLAEDDVLYMIFRIGYPKKTVKRSRRLSLTINSTGILN